MSDYYHDHCGIPKQEAPATTKGRKDRATAKRVKSVRSLCVERDGYCRIARDTGDVFDCYGPSEWCHFGSSKRFKTRGQMPEARHTTAGSFIACQFHHYEYDHRELKITAVDQQLGCDGELRYARPVAL